MKGCHDHDVTRRFSTTTSRANQKPGTGEKSSVFAYRRSPGFEENRSNFDSPNNTTVTAHAIDVNDMYPPTPPRASRINQDAPKTIPNAFPHCRADPRKFASREFYTGRTADHDEAGSDGASMLFIDMP